MITLLASSTFIILAIVSSIIKAFGNIRDV
jgi:hypothetical protein